MTSRANTVLVLAAAGLMMTPFLAGCASSQHAEADRMETMAVGWEGREWGTFQHATQSDVYLGGQPSAEAIEAFADMGGTTVINLRTPAEIESTPGYEAAVRATGMDYHLVPTTGSTMTPEHAVRIMDLVDAARGPVLLHCASGGRASYVWAMDLAATTNMTAAEANNWAEKRTGRTTPWEAGRAAIYAAAGEDMPATEAPAATN